MAFCIKSSCSVIASHSVVQLEWFTCLKHSGNKIELSVWCKLNQWMLSYKMAAIWKLSQLHPAVFRVKVGRRSLWFEHCHFSVESRAVELVSFLWRLLCASLPSLFLWTHVSISMLLCHSHLIILPCGNVSAFCPQLVLYNTEWPALSNWATCQK